MEVEFTPVQRTFVRQAIDSGRLRSEEDVVKQALSLWEQRERVRAEILAAVDEGEASLARAGRRPVARESTRELSAEVRRRGRSRLAAAQPVSR